LQGRFIGASVISVVMQVLVDLVGEFVAFFEALVVCANKHDTQVEHLETDINVKHVVFGATWNADWRPRLSIGH